MAVDSVLRSGGNEPDNGPRNFVDDSIQALKDRIAEYKVHGRDTEYMEERLTKLQNSKKGRRKAEDDADRNDVDDCVVDEQEKARLAREAGKSPAHKKRHGVPDQKSEGSSNPISDAGEPADVPDQTSPWAEDKLEPAITQPPLPKAGEGQDQGSSQNDKASKPAAAAAKEAVKDSAKSDSKPTPPAKGESKPTTPVGSGAPTAATSKEAPLPPKGEVPPTKPGGSGAPVTASTKEAPKPTPGTKS